MKRRSETVKDRSLNGRRLAAYCFVALTVLAMSACGRKGPLEPHPDDPIRQTAGKATQDPGASSFATGGFRKKRSSPITPPNRPFILDALL